MIRRTSLLCLVAAAAVLAWVPPARAVTTGGIVGTVREKGAGVIVGASVILASESMQGVQRQTTQKDGTYRFPLLSIGTYKVTVSHDGFQSAEQPGIRVTIDSSIRVDVDLTPGAMVEGGQVEIRAVRPLVDQKRNNIGATLEPELLMALPTGRKVKDALDLVPGATSDSLGVSFGGATSTENAWIMDGVNSGHLTINIPQSSPPIQFIQQVEVKTGGYQAEHGRAQGAVITIVTKSGGNEFHGSVFADYQSDKLDLKLVPDAVPGTYFGYDLALDHSVKLGFELGGYIKRDKLWFWVGLSPTLERATVWRIISSPHDDDGDGSVDLTNQDLDNDGSYDVAFREIARQKWNNWNREWQLGYNFTYTLAEGHTLKFFHNGFFQRLSGAFGDEVDNVKTLFNAPEVFMTKFEIDRHSLGLQYNAQLFEKSMLIEAQVSRYHQLGGSHPLTAAGRGQRFRNMQLLPHPEFPQVQYFGYIYGGSSESDRVGGRNQFTLALTNFVKLFGHHEIKYGSDVEIIDVKSSSRYSGNGIYTRYYGLDVCNRQRIDEYVFVPADPNAYPEVLKTPHEVASSRVLYHSYFLRDSWNVIPNLTFNLGMRFERQEYRNYLNQVKFLTGRFDQFNNGWSPRLGAIYDWTNTGKTKFEIGFGRFYQELTTSIGEYSFSPGSQAQRTYFVQALPAPIMSPTPCATVDPIGPWSYSSGSDTPVQTTVYDPLRNQWLGQVELKGQFHDEITMGYKHEILPDLSAGLTMQRKYVVRVIEDVSFDNGLSYIIVNPGFGSARWSYKPPLPGSPAGSPNRAYPIPRPVRSYTSWAFTLEKRLSKGWQLVGSYVISRNYGNYPGQFNDQYGHTLLNIQPDYDLADLHVNSFGELQGSRRHVLKLDGSYERDFGRYGMVTASPSIRLRSGQPINAWGEAYTDDQYGQVFIVPRGSAGRTPVVFWGDLKFKWGYKLKGGHRVSVFVDIFNLLNQRKVFDVDQNYTFESIQYLIDPNRSSSVVYNGEIWNLDQVKSHTMGTDPSDPIQAAVMANLLDGLPANDFLVSPTWVGGPAYGMQYDYYNNPDGFLVDDTGTRWVIMNPNYGLPSEVLKPRRIRVGIEYTF